MLAAHPEFGLRVCPERPVAESEMHAEVMRSGDERPELIRRRADLLGDLAGLTLGASSSGPAERTGGGGSGSFRLDEERNHAGGECQWPQPVVGREARHGRANPKVAGDSRATPTNDLPDATSHSPHRPAPPHASRLFTPQMGNEMSGSP